MEFELLKRQLEKLEVAFENLTGQPMLNESENVYVFSDGARAKGLSEAVAEAQRQVRRWLAHMEKLEE